MFEFSHTVTAELEKMDREGREMINPFVPLEELEHECEGDQTLLDLLHNMCELCIRYAESVFEFNGIAMQGEEAKKSGEFSRIDSKRKRIHDAAIDSVNILARNLKRNGKDNSWIAKLTAIGRPAYTKFALIIAHDLMLKERM